MPEIKVAIVGCGYVGSAVAEHWQAQGLDVLVTTTREERVAELKPLSNQVVVLSGTDRDRLQAALADRQVVLFMCGLQTRCELCRYLLA